MSREDEKQENAWLLAGTAIPLAVAAAECGWIGAGLAGLVMLVLLAVNGMLAPEHLPGWLRNLQVIAGTVLLGVTARMLTQVWIPQTESRAVALILLLVAAHACTGGREKPARIGAVLLRLIVLGSLLILYYGVAEQKGAAKLEAGTSDLGKISLLSLIPAVTAEMHPGKKGKGILLMLLMVILTGCLTGKTSLYSWVSGLTWNGKPLRMEVLLSVLVVTGWYASFTLQLAAIGEKLKKAGNAGIRQYGLYPAVLGAAAMIFWRAPEEGYLTAALILLYTVFPGMKKALEIKRRKREKRVDK